MKNSSLDLRAQNPVRYTLEAYGIARASKSAFGQPLIQRLFDSHPYLEEYAAWFTDTLQPEDTFLVVDTHRFPFAIQVDPVSEHIIIWDSSGFHIELGYWLEDPDAEAFSVIYDRYLSPAADDSD